MSKKYFSLRFGKVIALQGNVATVRYYNGKVDVVPFQGRFAVGDLICVWEQNGIKELYANIHQVFEKHP